jgi:uncharacterized membrane protein YccC
MTAATAPARRANPLRRLASNPYALRRAIRAAVIAPLCFAIGSEVIGNPQAALFAGFGAFALLLFIDFPGNRSSRLAAYSLLGVTGALLIAVGTLLFRPVWLAVLSMAVIGFIVLFSGAISSITAAAGRAALLTFILPVMVPADPADIPMRLLGWAVAVVIAVPISVFLWPPQDQNRLRSSAAELCRSLADMLRLQRPDGAGDPLVEMSRRVKDLRAAFHASASRPVALSTGSRLLMTLVEELEWLTTAVANACAEAPEVWPEVGRKLRATAAETLDACAAVLDYQGRSGPGVRECGVLYQRIQQLRSAREAVSAQTLVELSTAARTGAGVSTVAEATERAAPGEFDRPLYAAHELGYTVGIAAATVSAIAAADSRSWWQRLLGKRTSFRTAEPGVDDAPALANVVGEATAAEHIAAGHLDRHSVWLQNSIRGAAGLALAVFIARISGQQEGFWIVLGALSVLRSNALTTGATVLRALIGTVIGFAIGGLLVGLIGTDLTVLWALLPIAVFVAAFAPDVISFTAGQAAFTVVVIILFNIIAPAGWRIGVLRVEDVALGCLASLIAGFLFWPRGAGAALGAALSEAYRAGALQLRQGVDYVTGRRNDPPDTHLAAAASGWRLDDALRQYLAERGAKHVPLESVTTLANGASRLRLAGTAVTRLMLADANSDGYAELSAPVGALTSQTEALTTWYHSLGDVLMGENEPLPAVTTSSTGESFLEVVLPAVDRCGDQNRARLAERLLWSGQYLGDVNRLRADLVEPAADVRARWRQPWWRR